MTGEGFFETHARLTAKKVQTRAAKPAAAPDTATAITVTQLTAMVDGALKAGLPGSLNVRGEVSNANLHRASGHLYFTLKDAGACIDCVMFKDSVARLKFNLSDGIEMVASGRVGVYAQRGRYQFYASSLSPVGQGALELAFRQLQAKLAAEGLFAPGRKRPIPAYPTRIVLMTSKSTAALQDMLKVLRRFSWLHLMVYHVPVQGEGAAAKIAEGLSHLNQFAESIGGVDVILLARGGGSLEDLWAFNEESVARAVAASRIPIVTGIGHEVDCSIADLVADHHAHTPTEAAQTITSLWKQAADSIDLQAVRLRRGIWQQLADAKTRLTAIERHETFRRPMDRVNSLRQLLDDRQRSMSLAMSRRMQLLSRKLYEADTRLQARGPAAQIRNYRERLSRDLSRLLEFHPKHQIRLAQQRVASIEKQLQSSMHQNQKMLTTQIDTLERQLRAVGPEQVLKRGYTITSIKKSGVILRSASQLKGGERIVTRFADGQAESLAEDPRQLPLFE